MATIIGLAYLSWGAEIHLPGSASRIEEIRRLTTQMKSLTKESERALADAQMLYGAHVYSVAKVFPDTALVKGEEAYHAARPLGEHVLEFVSAGGTAMANCDIGAVEEAERWLDRAAAVASASPTPLRAGMLESWRGRVRATAGDAAGMLEHLERAIQIATEQGRPSGRCEALARLAIEAARLGAEQKDEELLAVAERCARDTKALLPVLPGRPTWGAQADAALARVALARGAPEEAAQAWRAALAALEQAQMEDLVLEIQLPAADALLTAGSEEEGRAVRDRLSLMLALILPRILGEEVRVRWLSAPIGRELTRLAGPPLTPADGSAHPAAGTGFGLDDGETALLRLLTKGYTNRDIAQEFDSTEESVALQLAELFVKIGASSRTDAAAVALMGKLG
jgi:DNA-binding NarL/FixJ family response regulator